MDSHRHFMRLTARARGKHVFVCEAKTCGTFYIVRLWA